MVRHSLFSMRNASGMCVCVLFIKKHYMCAEYFCKLYIRHNKDKFLVVSPFIGFSLLNNQKATIIKKMKGENI